MLLRGNFLARIVGAYVFVMTFGCANCGNGDPVVHMPKDTDRCEAACKHLVDLGCPEGQPLDTPIGPGYTCDQGLPTDLPDGGMVCRTECKDWCAIVQANGIFLSPSCVEKISKCEELETLCSTNPHP